MRTALAFVVALTLTTQTFALEITNARSTYGVRGAVRTNDKYLPGDVFVLSFDIDGFTVDPEGKLLYSMALEVSDAKKVIYRKDPKDLVATIHLGGKQMPAVSKIDIGSDLPAGKLTVKVTVTDRVSKASATVSKAIEVLPMNFGIVDVSTSSDAEMQASTTLFGAGESLFANFRLVGFARDRSSMQPKVSFEVRVLDSTGKPTTAKPFVGEINDKVPASAVSLPAQFLLSLNRPGKFTIEIKAMDQVASKTATISIPLTVQP